METGGPGLNNMKPRSLQLVLEEQVLALQQQMAENQAASWRKLKSSFQQNKEKPQEAAGGLAGASQHGTVGISMSFVLPQPTTPPREAVSQVLVVSCHRAH